MKIDKDTSYCVAPLTRKDEIEIVEGLEASHHGSGVGTFEVCREVAKRLPDKSINLCAAREDRYRPCTTLCYVCVEILHELLLRSWERSRE